MRWPRSDAPSRCQICRRSDAWRARIVRLGQHPSPELGEGSRGAHRRVIFAERALQRFAFAQRAGQAFDKLSVLVRVI